MVKRTEPYKKLSDIPAHIFRDRQHRDPVGTEFRNYLRYMLEHYPEDLHYIQRKSQIYVEYEGGSYYETYPQWRTKLIKKLQEYEQEDKIK